MKERQWLVTLRATYRGCQAIVHAQGADEAQRKAEAGDFISVETGAAELVGWSVSKVERDGWSE